MKKILIEGINGSLELNEKYIYLILSFNERPSEEHVIWFDEIENIIYKKPTRYKYGYISLSLFSKSFVTNRNKTYKIILDKIDEKSIESNKILYLFIKDIVENNNVKILEVVSSEKEEVKEVKKVKEAAKEEVNVEKVDTQNEIKQDKNLVKREENKTIEIEHKGLKEETKEIKATIETSINGYVEAPTKEEQEISFEKSNKEIDEEKEEYSLIQVDSNYIEKQEETLKETTKLEQEEKEEEKEEEKVEEKEKKPKSIVKLEEKAKELEKELQKLTYKEIILSEYLDNTLDRKKIDKLIIEIKKILEAIEKIKKEINKHEKIINGDDFIKLDNGNVTILSIDKSLLDETELNKYITQYEGLVDKLDRIKKDTNELSQKSEKKRKDVGLSDDEYERKINQLKGVKDNKVFINKLIKGLKEDLSKVKWRIETTTEKSVKYKYVRKEISKQTKMLASVTALNSIRPRRSRFSMVALSLFTGVNALHDIFGFDIKKVEYNEIVQKGILEGLEYIDSGTVRFLINSSKEEIDRILYDCDKNYSEYPQFNSLRKDLLSLKKEIEAQDKELMELEEKIREYNSGPKVKTLRFNQE